jgi:hypothetical protein
MLKRDLVSGNLARERKSSFERNPDVARRL